MPSWSLMQTIRLLIKKHNACRIKGQWLKMRTLSIYQGITQDQTTCGYGFFIKMLGPNWQGTHVIRRNSTRGTPCGAVAMHGHCRCGIELNNEYIWIWVLLAFYQGIQQGTHIIARNSTQRAICGVVLMQRNHKKFNRRPTNYRSGYGFINKMPDHGIRQGTQCNW